MGCFPKTSQKHARRWIASFKFPLDVNECVYGALQGPSVHYKIGSGSTWIHSSLITTFPKSLLHAYTISFTVLRLIHDSWMWLNINNYSLKKSPLIFERQYSLQDYNSSCIRTAEFCNPIGQKVLISFYNSSSDSCATGFIFTGLYTF